MLVWLIGLSGAGKSAIGTALRDRLVAAGRPCLFIDGDIMRELCGNDLGHTLADRRLNADRICRFGRYISEQGIDVVVGILSLFPESRAWNREHVPDYFEVYVRAPLATLEARDNKGLYARARRGELKDVAGIDLPFPEPERPDLVLDNDFTRTPADYADEILAALRSRRG